MPRRFWTEAELNILREQYPTRSTIDIAKEIGRNVFGVYNAAKKLGVKKSAAFIASDASGRLRNGAAPHASIAHRFPKGHVPANKGARRPGWHAGRMRETQFKKGSMNGAAQKKWRPIGTILADREGYLRIKVRERITPAEAGWHKAVWPLLHHVVWQENKGPIPSGHLVTFKDRNRSNCAIENLELMLMGDNARRNQMYASLPRELADVIHLAGVLKRELRSQSAEK